MDRIGVGRFLKTRHGTIFARVELIVHDPSVEAPTTSFACSGAGWVGQGYIEEVPASGYDHWKQGAAAGIEFAFRLAGETRRATTVTKIEGTHVDSNPASVGAAAALAIFDALSISPPESFQKLVEDMVFGGPDAEFSV